MGDILEKLYIKRLVQPHFLTDLLDHSRIHMLSHHGGDRITRDNAQHDKNQQHHTHQYRDGDQNPLEYFL